MKFQLRQHGWAIEGGRQYFPTGTIVDTADAAWAKIMSGHGGVPPANAQPLDQAAYDAMRRQFEPFRIFTVPGVDGINRW
jgi:hypothetical protein